MGLRWRLPDEQIAPVAWADLDRVVEADHLTSVYLPRLVAPVGAAFADLMELMRTLRAECPWDREQTHASLRRYLLEESYEVLEAIDGYDPESGEGSDHLEEELGDLLFQVVFHSALGSEAGWFTLADVATTVTEKLRARHPHVFAGATVSGVDELRATWEQQKQREKGRGSIYEGIPAALPALAYATKVLRKASAAGHDVQLGDDETADSATAERLMAVVVEANGSGVDAEQALRAALDSWLASQ